MSYHPQFTCVREFPIEEINCTFRELKHEMTGATVIHLENDDPENLFCMSFRTTPNSSNGVAHILEHLVLCGSKKYPVGDPFFAMSRRSLNTFMNAMTGADFTCYPCATQDKKDFYNLLGVYLDCVFNPTLQKLSFLQEGHRYEFSEQGKLQYNGIVFNEMKGALASPTARLEEALYKELLPNTTYSNNSGGDPKNIPELSYEELLAFHREYYHPSRCTFFFYGNLPLSEHLEFIAQNSLTGVTKVEPLTPLVAQKRFKEPKQLEMTYPGQKEDDTYLAVAWLTENIKNQIDILALMILEIAILGTDASPLKRALYNTKLCSQVSTSLESEMPDIPIVISMKGVKRENRQKLEQIILDELKAIIKEGISKADIENAMHQVEFYRSEISDDHHPYGLTLFFRSILLQQHGVAPEEGLKIHSLFKQLEERWKADPRYFENLVDKYLCSNTHRVSIFMEPDPALEQKELDDEKARLAVVEQKLTAAEKEQIISDTVELIKLQEKEVDHDDYLPGLTRDDIKQYSAKDYPISKTAGKHFDVYHHACFTNRILYAEMCFDLPYIPVEDWSIIRLFASLMPQLGSGGRTFEQQLNLTIAKTGGIAPVLGYMNYVDKPDDLTPTLTLKGKALYRNAEFLIPMMRDMIQSLDLSNKDRIIEIIRKQVAQYKSHYVNQCMGYASKLSKAGLRTGRHFENIIYGLPYYHFILGVEANFDAIIDKLAAMKETLFTTKPDLIFSCTQSMFDEMREKDFYNLTFDAKKAQKPWVNAPFKHELIDLRQEIPANIGFISSALTTVPYTHPDSPCLSVIASVMNQTVLHKRIREQGGAYGGGCGHNFTDGVFGFQSFRDPNIDSTFAAFDEALETILEGDFTETEIFDGVLDILQDFDSPVSPGSRAEVAYSWMRCGKDLEKREAFRKGLLAVNNKKQLQDVTKRHLTKERSSVVFAGDALLKKASKL